MRPGTRYQEGWKYGAQAAKGVERYTPYSPLQLDALKKSDPGWVDGYRHGWASAVAMGEGSQPAQEVFHD